MKWLIALTFGVLRNILFSFFPPILPYITIGYLRAQHLILQTKFSRMFKDSIYLWVFYIRYLIVKCLGNWSMIKPSFWYCVKFYKFSIWLTQGCSRRLIWWSLFYGFPGGSVVKKKNLLANARDVGSIPGSGKFPGEGNGNQLQYSCLGNPMDSGAWWATVHEVTKELDTT